MQAKGKAKIKDRASGRIREISGDDMTWEHISSEEREMGTQNEYQGTYSGDDETNDLEITVWEYPSGAFNSSEVTSGEYEIIQDFSYDFD